ncbi:hypothetical protein LINGRAHAP2_LOCUS15401 [Linum grandiflorum]
MISALLTLVSRDRRLLGRIVRIRLPR